MSLHIAGAVVTHHGVANNNRGENEGNITTLQKLLWSGRVHTTVSAEAIRWAIRYRWQIKGATVRREWNDEEEDYQESMDFNPETYLDDDVMGYMLAEGAKTEAGEEKGKTTKRRGVLEVTRAVSLTPYAGDITFNAKAGTKGKTSLYGAEIHATRFQYGFAMTPERLYKKARSVDALQAILALGEVAGNHSRYLYDFSPESIAIRIGQDPSPRLLYCYEQDGEEVTAPKLLRAVQVGDIAPGELIVGGALADTATGEALKEAGVELHRGVRAAGDAALARLREELG